MFNFIKKLLFSNYNLGKATYPRRWENYHWTEQDKVKFSKKFKSQVK